LGMTKKLVLIMAVVLAIGGTAQADGIDPIVTRQAGLDLLAGTFAGVKAVITANGDVKSLEGAGTAIKKWAAQFPTLFPAGSDTGNTKAAPAIWSDQAGFQKAAMRLSAAGEALGAAAKSGDASAVAAAFKETGDACGACHKDYRLK
jgi:cytochrome c556